MADKKPYSHPRLFSHTIWNAADRPRSVQHLLQADVTQASDRRRTPRYRFSARAEVTPEGGGSISMNVSELSLYGCYLRFITPLDKGTSLLVRIFSESEYIETTGRVVYANPDHGMGIAFTAVKPENRAMLERWLFKAEQEITEATVPK
jgi:PilZ domain